MKHLLLGALLCACISIPASAQTVRFDNDGRGIAVGAGPAPNQAGRRQYRQVARLDIRRPRRVAGVRRADQGLDPRPRAWCAWFLRRKLGIPKDAFPKWSYNLAYAFKFIGTPAPANCTNCIAVMPHHVGLVHDRRGGEILLESGNDGRAVRTRWRPARGIIAYRWPPGFRLARL